MIRFSTSEERFAEKDYRISAWYAYHQAFNECLHNHPETSSRGIMDMLQTKFSFDLSRFWFCLTGVKKDIYWPVYHIDAPEYIEVFRAIRIRVLNLIESMGYNADIFMVMMEDEKQMGILLSPGTAPRCAVRELAERIGALAQEATDELVFRGDSRYCNVAALTGELHGFSDIREGYLQARALNDLAFFRMVPQVLTAEDVDASRNGADYPSVMDACIQLLTAVDEGDAPQTDMLLNNLLLSLLRNSYSLPLCRDALSFLKSALQIRCTVYGLMDGLELDTLCDVEHYHKIEECAQALGQVFERLCAAVRERGHYSKVVLHAAYYIKCRYADDISLPDVARYANVTPTYLSTHFKENTGMALRDYVTAARIERARGLLAHGEQKVAEVAGAVGFYDAKYFTRTFKRLTGHSPAEYRAQIQQNNCG